MKINGEVYRKAVLTMIKENLFWADKQAVKDINAEYKRLMKAKMCTLKEPLHLSQNLDLKARSKREYRASNKTHK